LYDGMKKAGRLPTHEEMAEKLNVSIGVALAVQSPTHFDLPYRKDWKGMKFGHLLSGFKGPVHLMHGSESGVCTSQQVKDLLRAFPKAQVLEVAGAAHPVPFNAAVNQFVLQSLNLPAAPVVKPESVHEVVVPMQMQLAMPLETAQDTPLKAPEHVNETESLSVTSRAVVPQEQQHQELKPRPSLIGFLKQLLGATKK
jgi:hypothetical protein